MTITQTTLYYPVLSGTSAQGAYTALDEEGNKISDRDYEYVKKLIESLNYSWEESTAKDNVFTDSLDGIDKYQIMHSFAIRFLKDLHDIDPSFVDTINKNFWDLI